jgi:hypothetical protein
LDNACQQLVENALLPRVVGEYIVKHPDAFTGALSHEEEAVQMPNSRNKSKNKDRPVVKVKHHHLQAELSPHEGKQHVVHDSGEAATTMNVTDSQDPVESMFTESTFRRVTFSPTEFVSGGQTGADSIPFSVFEGLGIGLIGFMHKGFERGDGRGREIAARYGLTEGEGGNKWRDCQNAERSDACLAFLTTLPMTGRGTMQTVQLFVSGRYKHIQLDKPDGQDHLVISNGCKPAIIFWDISEDKIDSYATLLHEFLQAYRPRALMLSGPMEKTWPGIELLGAKLLRCTLLPSDPTAATLLNSTAPESLAESAHEASCKVYEARSDRLTMEILENSLTADALLRSAVGSVAVSGASHTSSLGRCVNDQLLEGFQDDDAEEGGFGVTFSHEAAGPAKLSLDVSDVSSLIHFYRACGSQISVGASNLNGFADSLKYVGQMEDFDEDSDELRRVELRVVGFAKCKAFLLNGTRRVGDKLAEILRSYDHIHVTFEDALEVNEARSPRSSRRWSRQS